MGLAKNLPKHNHIAAGFPGVVKEGVVYTAPNLGTKAWAGFDLDNALIAAQLAVLALVINDAGYRGPVRSSSARGLR